MDMTALFLSRIQSAFTITFHIIFPSFTIGLAAWLTVLETLHLRTGRHVLHLSAYPHRSPWQAVRDTTSRSSEPADVAGR
ncbi:hypothetical protein V1289_005331 [Bradyrhizobium sp. AZCC 2289]